MHQLLETQVIDCYVITCTNILLMLVFDISVFCKQMLTLIYAKEPNTEGRWVCIYLDCCWLFARSAQSWANSAADHIKRLLRAAGYLLLLSLWEGKQHLIFFFQEHRANRHPLLLQLLVGLHITVYLFIINIAMCTLQDVHCKVRQINSNLSLFNFLCWFKLNFKKWV